MNTYINRSKILLITGLLSLGVSCNEKEFKQEQSSVQESTAFEAVIEEAFIVRVQDKDSSKVMSLSLKYSGKKDLKKSLEGQKDAVQNLLISVLSDYSLEKLKTKKGKENFQNKILNSLNEFVAENKFTKVDLINLKEI